MKMLLGLLVLHSLSAGWTACAASCCVTVKARRREQALVEAARCKARTSLAHVVGAQDLLQFFFGGLRWQQMLQ